MERLNWNLLVVGMGLGRRLSGLRIGSLFESQLKRLFIFSCDISRYCLLFLSWK